jgi:hyperosmotically inducible periplasmic protein
MRLIRRLVLLAIVGAGGLAAYNYWSDDGWSLGPSAAGLDGERAVQAARLAHQAAAKAHDAADKLGDKVSQGALTAKIKSKMALDDHIQARDINVDTSGSIVTLTGVVASADEHDRALRLARDTEGVTEVVDKLRIRKP